MATTRIMPCHTGNGKTILSSIKESLDYGKNPDKTRDGEFISSYECSPQTAEYEFLISKKQYEYTTSFIILSSFVFKINSICFLEKTPFRGLLDLFNNILGN